MATAGIPANQSVRRREIPEIPDNQLVVDTDNLIGKSCFCVYAGYWNERPVAIKYLTENAVSHTTQPILKTVQQAFEQEADIMGRLDHPNVLPLLGIHHHSSNSASAFFLWQKQVWLVMPLMACSLDKALYKGVTNPRCKVESPPAKIRVAREITAGLEYLHTRTPIILHRDMKSPNVLLDEKGIAKICDFGFAKLIENDDPATRKWYYDIARGTCEWAAPEILSVYEKNKKEEQSRERYSKLHYTVQADIYSLGVIFWEIITQDQARLVDSPNQKLQAIKERRKAIKDRLEASQDGVQAIQDRLRSMQLANEEDPALRNLVEAAYHCCRLLPRDRPENINAVQRYIEPVRRGPVRQ